MGFRVALVPERGVPKRLSASLLTGAFRRRLPIGVLLGLAASVLGLWLSFLADLPTGPTVVVVLGLLPIAAALARPLLRVVNKWSTNRE